MSDHIDPDRLREVLLKLEVTQFARGELHAIRADMREILERDLSDHRRELRARNNKIIFIAISTAAVIIGGDFWTIRETANRAQDAVNVEVQAVRARSRGVLASEVQRIQHEVSERLNHEFAEPRIRQLIEEKAREYTEVQARSYIAAQVDSGLKPFRQEVAAAVDEVSKQRDSVAAYKAKVGEAFDEL